IPTSLLSMVDSSVGGKVGVDLPEGKNLVGAFKQPDLVLIDPNVLYTLPPREWRCGLGEVIKHGLLADTELLDMLSPSQATAPDVEQLVRRAVQVKVGFVQQDPYEHDVRAYLNLGHTFAHAIEQVTHYQTPHGEAVAAGLVAAAWLSARLGLCDNDLVGLVEAKVAGVGLPVRLSGLKPEQLWAAMATDKKWESGQVRFVLLKDVGQPTIVEDIEKEDVFAILESIR
ncbi:MAG: 3-dehydroquinate synthase, partial [Anaerolineae bacterium]|nr:3-dehydroquinate synthase [Anaerolineae bacterium]